MFEYIYIVNKYISRMPTLISKYNLGFTKQKCNCAISIVNKQTISNKKLYKKTISNKKVYKQTISNKKVYKQTISNKKLYKP